MEDEAFRHRLQEVCSDQIEMYRRRYPEKPPQEVHIQRELTEPLAPKKDIYTCFDALTDIYDDLLAIDPTTYRDL